MSVLSWSSGDKSKMSSEMPSCLETLAENLLSHPVQFIEIFIPCFGAHPSPNSNDQLFLLYFSTLTFFSILPPFVKTLWFVGPTWITYGISEPTDKQS